jgi:hypothetical protein
MRDERQPEPNRGGRDQTVAIVDLATHRSRARRAEGHACSSSRVRTGQRHAIGTPGARSDAIVNLIAVGPQGIGVRDDEWADYLDSPPEPAPAQRFDRFVSGRLLRSRGFDRCRDDRRPAGLLERSGRRVGLDPAQRRQVGAGIPDRGDWPAGTKVHVSASLYGVPLAPGAYDAADITTDFTISRNQVVIADVNSHQLLVQRNDATVATYPASYGRGEDTGDPNLITRSGIHVVNGMDETKLMGNPPRYGYSNVP